MWLAIGVAGAALDAERRDEWRRATATVAATYALNTAIKRVVGRRRPQLPGLPALTSTPTSLSFPSAHASHGFRRRAAVFPAGAARGPLYALATGLALSRLYLGVHYPSDVLAGAVLGSLAPPWRRTAANLRDEARRLAADPRDRAEASMLRDELDDLAPPWPVD